MNTTPLSFDTINKELVTRLEGDDVGLAYVEMLGSHFRALRGVLQGIAGDERHSCLACGMLGEHRPTCDVGNVLAHTFGTERKS